MSRAVLVCGVGSVVLAGAASASGPSGTVQGRVLVNPLSVAVVVPADPVKAGKDFRVHAQVTNAGAGALQNVAVTLLAPSALLLRDPATQALGRFGPAETRTVHWGACTITVGGYVVMARATVGSFTAESRGGLIRITSSKLRRCP